MNRILATLCAASLFAAIPLRAQEPEERGPDEESPLFPSRVELVNVDVVVADDDGNPVRGLTADDFRLEEDGKAQTITSFEAIELPDEPVEEVPPRPPVSSNTVKRPETGRTMVVLFDDVHMDAQQAQRAKSAVKAFLEEGTRPGDIVTLVAPGDGTWWTSRMPHGREELIDLLKRLEGRHIEPYRGPDRVTEWEAMRIHVYRDEQVVNRVTRRFAAYGVNPLADNTGRFTAGTEDPMVYGRAMEVYYQALSKNRITLDVMERILDSLEASSGRKSLILVSEGFIYDPNMDEFKRVKEASRRSNAAVYFLDTRGLQGISVYNTAEFGPALDTRDLGASFLDSLEASAGSESIAIDTGGFTVKNTNDLAKGIQRIADEARNYYIIGYRSTNTSRDGRFREIEVKVDVDDVKVRARKGYYAPTDGPSAFDAEKKDGADPQLQAAMDSPFQQSDVPIRMTDYVLEETLLGKARVLLAAEVDVRNFAFEERLDVSSGEVAGTRYVDTLEFLLVATHRETGEYFTYDQKVDMKLRRPTLEKVGAEWFPIVRELELQAGHYQVKFVVRDSNSKTVGSLVHEFAVPDLGELRVSSPIISDDLVEQEEGVKGPPTPRILARRTFDNDGVLIAKYEVYGAERDPETAMPRVTAGYRILRADGSVHMALDPTEIQPTSLGGVSRITGTRLKGAAPGDYEIVIDVQDQLSGKTLQVREPFTLVEPSESRVDFVNVRPGPPLGVTLAKFQQVREGMSYDEVAAILGDDGFEESRSVVGTVTTVVYSWANENGSQMTATFENDALVSKGQTGLPSVAASAAGETGR